MHVKIVVLKGGNNNPFFVIIIVGELREKKKNFNYCFEVVIWKLKIYYLSSSSNLSYKVKNVIF